MHNIESNQHAVFSMLPRPAKQRLINVSLGWVLVAVLEAIAYATLAFAIAYHWPPYWVLSTAFVAILVTIVVTRSGYLTGVRLAGDLFAELGQSLSQAKLSWFSNQQRAAIGNMAGQGIPSFMSIPAHQLQTFLHAPCLPLFVLIAIALLAGIQIAAVALLLITLSFIVQIYAQRALIKSDKQRNEAELASATSTIELVEHLELLRTAVGPDRAIARIEQRWDAQEKIFAAINRRATWATFIATLTSVLPMAGIAIYWLLVGDDNSALLFAVVLLIGRATAPLDELATAGLGINDVLNSIANFNRLTHAPILSEPQAPQQPQGYNISLQEVTYRPVLKKINSEILEQSRVHIAGVSGSGKSTLLELLMRFDDLGQGQIKLGGIPLSQMLYADLVANIAYVSQDPVIFTGTLAENVRLGQAGASDAEVESVIRQVALGYMIERSSAGINQTVGQQGSALSGGERQRVAIARALLKAAPILILDEATSALDDATERVVVRSILEMSQTLIFVTHRDAAIWQPTQTINLSLQS